MKYGATLLESLNPEWRFFYIEYGQLKTFLKDRLKINGNGQFTESDETEFVNMLENELDKVYSFQKLKSGEIQRHVKYCEHSIEEIGKASNEVGADPAEVSMRYLNVENEINGIIVEVNELAKFQRLNFAGFIKIVKKHDKHTGIPLKTMFSLRLSKKPFYKENFDPLLLKLSRLCEIVRNGGKTATSSSGKSASAAAAGAGQSFVRQTTKYWVHPDNVMELKLFVLKHLPVLVYKAQAPKTFGPKTDADADSDESVDPAITSIYFDNDDLQLYLGRLEKSEGAEAVRLRWYGNARNEEIFVERKTHREDWTGEKSVKERFMIKEKHVNDYLNGKYNMSKYAAKLRETGAKGEDQINSMEQLSNEIQHTIIEKKLHPLVRTFYNRMAFQLPGDARVRISLDTELTMVREDNYDGVERSGSNWRRTDINTDYPFTHLADSDVCRFPYAILEVKLQTHVGTEPPQWVEELINSHLVEAVPKFSKFIHGVSTLLESRAPLFPFWLPQMDKDIRKP
ncbi:SPX-domain-containing protein, partial [Ramicandelaber brevisporus]